MDDDLEDAADGVAGAESARSTSAFMRASASGSTQLRRISSRALAAAISAQAALRPSSAAPTRTTWLPTSIAELAEQHLGEGSAGDAGGALAGAGAFEHVAGVGEVVLQGAGEVGVAGARAGDGLVLVGVARFDGEDLFPVLPVVVGEGHGDGRADGFAVTDAAEDVGGVALDAHAAAAAVALLAPPELAVEELLIDGDAGGQAADESDEGFAVTFTGG